MGCTVLLIDDSERAASEDRQLRSASRAESSVLEQRYPAYGSERRRFFVSSSFRGTCTYPRRISTTRHSSKNGLDVFPRPIALFWTGRPLNVATLGLAGHCRVLDTLLGGGIQRGSGHPVRGAAGGTEVFLAIQI